MFCFCSNGKGEQSQQGFGVSLLKALLDNMPYLPAAATGGELLGVHAEQQTAAFYLIMFTASLSLCLI